MHHWLATVSDGAVMLIATAQGEPLYRTLGFVEVERVCRLIAANPVRGPRLEPITDRLLPAVTDLDADAFGADRRGLIGAFLARAEATAVVSAPGGGISGFGMAVRQGGRLALGPVVARDDDTALALLGSLAADGDGEIRLEVPVRRRRIVEAFAALGAKASDDAPVMVYGAQSLPGRREAIYALASRGFG